MLKIRSIGQVVQKLSLGYTNKQTDRRTNRQTDRITTFTCPHTRAVIIIGALGTIPKSLERNLEELRADIAPELLQKNVVLETAHIIRRVMGS